MIPPTPTPFPVPDMPIDMPEFNLWDFAPNAVMSWQMAGSTWTTLIQAVLLILLVVFGIFMLVAFLRGMSNEGEGDEE